ncbi:Protein PLASTID REDOX INSENSITIVE 2, partial [Mucuna pruriens]
MLLFTSSAVMVTLYPAKPFSSNALIPRHCLPRPLPPSSPARLSTKPISRNSFTCALADSPTLKHVYPDPIPEFAESETQKFKAELFQKLSEDVDEFGDDLDEVVAVCAQIFSEFLHKEYGGPGTLLVEPFTDMMVALKKKKLPGAALAARASLLWAQNYVDKDWENYISL